MNSFGYTVSENSSPFISMFGIFYPETDRKYCYFFIKKRENLTILKVNKGILFLKTYNSVFLSIFVPTIIKVLGLYLVLVWNTFKSPVFNIFIEWYICLQLRWINYIFIFIYKYKNIYIKYTILYLFLYLYRYLIGAGFLSFLLDKCIVLLGWRFCFQGISCIEWKIPFGWLSCNRDRNRGTEALFFKLNSFCLLGFLLLL